MKKCEILVIDDNAGTVYVISEVLRALGYNVYTAKDFESGLHEFKKHRPALVITDLRLRNSIGGVHCCQEIKMLDPLTIVVAMSGYYEESYSLSFLRRQGFDHMIPKPVTKENLRHISECASRCHNIWKEIRGGNSYSK